MKSSVNIFILFNLFITINCYGQFSKIDSITAYSNYTSKMKTYHIPDSIFYMKNLKTLSIIGMECDIVILDEKGNNISECWVIKEIPSKISELKNLEYLNLSFNSIKSIPKDIQQLKQLKVLDLTDNSGLENIENILLPDNLEELYLYGCFLSRLPDNLTKLKRLKKLGLTGNNLTETEINRIKLELPNCEISF